MSLQIVSMIERNFNVSTATNPAMQGETYGALRTGRAIDVLLDAHRNGRLDEPGEFQLVDYLHRENRYAESIGLLRSLAGRRPESLQYRTWLMRAYFHAGKKDELLALLRQSDEFFHKDGRWSENALAGLAAICLETQLFEQSVAYYNELIPL